MNSHTYIHIFNRGVLLLGDSEVQRTMLELLNQLDGFEATKNIKVQYICTCCSHCCLLPEESRDEAGQGSCFRRCPYIGKFL